MTPPPEQRARSIVGVLLVCLAASTATSIAKVTYGYWSGSLAFLADGIHSLFDSGSTLLGIYSVRMASHPPDARHPYGHKKFEALSSLALSMMLLLAGWEVLSTAIARWRSEAAPPTFNLWGLALILANMAINLGVAAYEGRAAKRLKSHFLGADSHHNRSDFLISLGVLASLLGSFLSIPYFDLLASGAISLYLVYLAFLIVQSSIKPLVDHRVLEPNEVETLVNSVEGVLYCHNVRSRGEDWHHFLDLNIHLPGRITLEQAHEITHRVEAKLKAAFPGLVDVVIHTEPHNHPPCAKD